MPVADLNNPLVPAFDILVEGRSIPVEALTHVVGVSVEESVDWPSMFSVEIESSDDMEDEFLWIDDKQLFAVGGAVEVRMGYGDELEGVVKGEITGLEPTFTSGRLPTLVVRGYDRRHRLLRGRKTRTFLQQKDSQIASRVASEAGLSAAVTDSSVVHEYVMQANQTDWEFLQSRARRMRFEVVIEDKQLILRPVPNDKGEVLTLTTDDHLLEFSPRLSAARQVDSVSVRGWSAAEKKEFVVKAQSSDVTSTMGGEKSGPKMAQAAFGSGDILSAHLVATQAEADQVAKAQLNDLAMALIEGDGICVGRTDLRAGKVIKIGGVGKRFSGNYYVTNAVHRFSLAEGYSTSFNVRRNAS